MKLSAENVRLITGHCLPETLSPEDHQLASEGKAPQGYTLVTGVVNTFLFDKAKIEEKRADITSMLSELPDQFKSSGGGGCSFLAAYETDKGEHWGEHRDSRSLDGHQ